MKKVVVRRDETPSSGLAVMIVRYGECQRNHAATAGGYAVDGCREFIATREDGTGSSLVCAACSCHRNFHRRIEAAVSGSSRSSSNEGR